MIKMAATVIRLRLRVASHNEEEALCAATIPVLKAPWTFEDCFSSVCSPMKKSLSSIGVDKVLKCYSFVPTP